MSPGFDQRVHNSSIKLEAPKRQPSNPSIFLFLGYLLCRIFHHLPCKEPQMTFEDHQKMHLHPISYEQNTHTVYITFIKLAIPKIHCSLGTFISKATDPKRHLPFATMDGILLVISYKV